MIQDLDKIYEFIYRDNLKLILIINNNSKLVLNYLYNSIYNKYPLSKVKCSSGKGLMKKLSSIKNKLIRIDLTLNKVQLSSSTIQTDSNFNTLKTYIAENNSKILFKFDYNFDFNLSYHEMNQFMCKYDMFDLIILLDKNDIKILKWSYWNIRKNNNNIYSVSDTYVFSILKLVRNVKLKQLKNKT